MNTQSLFEADHRSKAAIVLAALLLILLAAIVLAWLVQRDFGNVDVTNVRFANENGISIRAKLLRPVAATATNPLPGAVYVHGYQNNRETSDPYSVSYTHLTLPTKRIV